MEHKTIGWISKLVTIAIFALMILQAVMLIHPMNKDDSRYDGVCNITSLVWYRAPCTRTSSNVYLQYDVPIITGGFAEVHGRPTISPGTVIQANSTVNTLLYSYLWVNESRTDEYGNGGPEVDAFLFDDNSDNPLIDCSVADIVSTKKLIAQYIPQLEPYLYVNSATANTVGSLDFYFNCTYENHNQKFGAFLLYKRTNKLYVIPFLITLFGVICGLYFIRKYDVDGPIKELSEFILQILFMFVFAVHYIYYLAFRIIIGQVIFNIDPPDPMDDLKAGSIFFPIVWLFKKAWKCYKSNRTDDNNESTSHTSSVSPEALPPPIITRRSSAPEINTRPHAPPSPPHLHHKPPSYPSIDREGTVIPNSVIVYHGEERTDLGGLPPPPSYDDVISNNM